MIWLIGAGKMSIDYAKVLEAQKRHFIVIGRGESSALCFQQDTGIIVNRGGIDTAIESRMTLPEFAIVATGVEALAGNCISLLNAGVKRILVEKPAGMNKDEINLLVTQAEEAGAKIFVAYNRRFYSSVTKAKEIIKEDGGVTSFNFEFTEWSHKIENLIKADGVMEEWFLANSSHVVDLAFYLGGTPKELSSYTSGSLNWHQRSSNFAGSGISNTGALFSYHANWESPGRWRVEVLTKKHRLYLSPMEQLQIQKIGSVAIENVKIDDELDNKYKPGLYAQVWAFLNDDCGELCAIQDQFNVMETYNKIAGYDND